MSYAPRPLSIAEVGFPVSGPAPEPVRFTVPFPEDGAYRPVQVQPRQLPLEPEASLGDVIDKVNNIVGALVGAGVLSSTI